MFSGTEWFVIFAGAGAVAWVNWYFFVAGRAPVTAASAPAAAGAQEQTIIVDGGYSPAVVRVKAGKPVRLVFDRRDTGGCSEEVVFPDFGVRRFLPTGKKTSSRSLPSMPAATSSPAA